MVGLGIILANEDQNIKELCLFVKNNKSPTGYAILIDIEKTDNIFARKFLLNAYGSRKEIGFDKAELHDLLMNEGFMIDEIVSKLGLLFALVH